MTRARRPNRSQLLLLPPSLDDWVDPKHPVRFVDDFVEALGDLAALGFRVPDAVEGRPPWATDLLLKIWLFGWMERVRSTRALEKACLRDVAFLWLTGNQHPDHNAFWRFFRDNRTALKPLFKLVVRAATEAGLVGFALHALDGTKMQAASATDPAWHRKALEDKLQQLDRFIEQSMQQVEQTEAQEQAADRYAMPEAMADRGARQRKIQAALERLRRGDDEPPPGPGGATRADSVRSEPLPVAAPSASPATETTPSDETPAETTSVEPKAKCIAEAQELRAQVRAQLDALTAAGTDHLHPDEAQARMMKGRTLRALGYNAQALADHDSDLILVADVVTNENDQGQLVPMLEQVLEVLPRVAEQTAADTGYYSGEQLAGAETRHLPVVMTPGAERSTKGPYSKAHFRYDDARDVYICPQGESLTSAGQSRSHAGQAHRDTVYVCRRTSCPVRAACTQSKTERRIRRSPFEEAMERQAQKQQNPAMAILLGLRKEIIEHVFGVLKGIDGFRRFTVRGLEKVRAQWAAACTAVNLRKLYAAWCEGRFGREAVQRARYALGPVRPLAPT